MKKVSIYLAVLFSLLALVTFIGHVSPVHAQWVTGSLPWYYVSADPTCGTGSAGALIVRKDLPALKFCNDSLVATAFPGGASSTWQGAQYRGICQNTVGSFGVSWGTDGSVTAATCPSLTNVTTGQLSFADSGAVTVWGSFILPTTIPSSITFTAGIVSSSTSQAYKTLLYTACVASSTQDPTFNTGQTLNFTSSGTAGVETVQTISSLTLTGCAGGNRLIWKFARDTTDTSTLALLVNYLQFVGN
jgi:hypothetical protein